MHLPPAPPSGKSDFAFVVTGRGLRLASCPGCWLVVSWTCDQRVQDVGWACPGRVISVSRMLVGVVCSPLVALYFTILGF